MCQQLALVRGKFSIVSGFPLEEDMRLIKEHLMTLLIVSSHAFLKSVQQQMEMEAEAKIEETSNDYCSFHSTVMKPILHELRSIASQLCCPGTCRPEKQDVENLEFYAEETLDKAKNMRKRRTQDSNEEAFSWPFMNDCHVEESSDTRSPPLQSARVFSLSQ